MNKKTATWNLPARCEVCPDRSDDYCRRYDRTIWVAWRMLDGCSDPHGKTP